MIDVSQVIAQMVNHDMPPLPANHPILDGKFKRFGPGKKAWYVLRELTLKSGRTVVTGAFGFFVGDNRNTVPVKIDTKAMSEEERTELVRQQRAIEDKEAAKKQREAELAANRARDQWRKASKDADQHPYLVRKQVTAENVRVDWRGALLVPCFRYSLDNTVMAGLQKIDAEGGKRYSTDMDRLGTAYVLGNLPGAPIIAIGEGYATCRTVRMVPNLANDLPVVVAFDAGGILLAAEGIRRDFPDAHLLFLADDDYQLEQRFIERLRTEFKVSVPVLLDGATHEVMSADGELVKVTAWWRQDPQGITFLETDVRKGRMIRAYKYENAGVSRCHAAAKKVGNASVVMPAFADRAGRKLTDWNDLHIEEGLDAVAAQIAASLHAAQQPRLAPPAPSDVAQAATVTPDAELTPSLPAAQQPKLDSPAPSDESATSPLQAAEDDRDALYAQAVSVVLKNRRVSVSLVQRELRLGYNRASRLIEQMEVDGLVSAVDSSGMRTIVHPAVSPLPSEKAPDAPASDAPAPPLGREKDLASAAGAPQGEELSSAAQVLRGNEEELTSAAEAPRDTDAAEAVKSEADVKALMGFSGTRPLEWVLDNFAQIYGSTDVWDQLNRLRFKRAAFQLMVTKDVVKAWDAHPERKVITIVQEAESTAGAPAAGGGGGGKKGKPKKEYGEEFFDKVDRLTDNFALIYGSDEVWDGEQRRILKINPLRLAFGNDVVKFWLNNPARKMVPVDQVVFDPTMKSDPATSVNLFNGFSLLPQAGECTLILELLHHLCGGDDAVFGWVLCWLAYPLQHPGAKMDTSIIMHGDEGSGKNLFFERCVARIYGEYAGVIGNAEIEDKFNDWASKKLFIVCDEVVTRAELRQLKGKLKSIVSGSTIRINPKGLASRDEANHMNLTFLSNELQPLALDKTDRRYMVIWTPAKQSEEYYAQVAKEIYGGGTEAFYHFLLGLDLGDFNEHTKPVHTEAKDNLISLGLSPAERFYREWKGGLLPLPYVCCSAMQLYQAFCRWSHLNGERFPATQTMFGRTISRISFGDMTSCPVKYDLMSDVKQRTVYLVGDQPEGKERNKWVEDGSATFEAALRKYRHVFERDDS